MSLSTTSIRRPVFTIVINLSIVLFGLIGYSFLGVREFPSIDPAQVSISTRYAGANSDIIESQITEPLEKAINSIVILLLPCALEEVTFRIPSIELIAFSKGSVIDRKSVV